MAKQDKMTIIKTNPYEIAKAEDIDFGFQSILTNTAFLMSLVVQAERDFIIGGKVRHGNGLQAIIEPFIAYCKDSGMLYCCNAETTVHLTIANAVHDRLDVISVGGEGWDTYQKEHRWQWWVTKNPTPSSGTANDSLALGYFDKRQKQNIEFTVLVGEPNTGTAKRIPKNTVKIAEVFVRARRELLDDTDIYCVEALEDGQQNKKWTAEKTRTFYIAPLTASLKRFFSIHKPDGTLKDGVVGKNNLALSSGDIITAADFSLGEDIEKRAEQLNPETNMLEPIVPIVGNAKLAFKILKTTKLNTVFEILVDAFIHVWKTFIESDRAVYRLSKEYTTEETDKLSQTLTDKINTEIEERKQADETEKTERIEAIEAEAAARKEADEAEKKERIEAIEKEEKERKEADETEKKERIEAIKAEQEERIAGDKKNEKLAKKAINLSLPAGSFTAIYDGEKHTTFLPLDGSSFKPQDYPKFYQYWLKHLAFWGTDATSKPFLPKVEQQDYSRLGELAVFIGDDYHHEFLICDGLPFSPDVYKEFYEKYWKKHFSHLGTDAMIGWPLRPKMESNIAGANVYIKVLAHENIEFMTAFIKTGEEL